MRSLIDTNIKNNVLNIRPYLGILLVASMALGLGLIITNATNELTRTVQTSVPKYIEGTIQVRERGDIHYGDTVTYKSSVSGLQSESTNTFITTVCFQGDTMVYQQSTQQGVDVHLYDQIGRGMEWDGKTASCSAALMYRKVEPDAVNVYVVDGVSFDVLPRTY